MSAKQIAFLTVLLLAGLARPARADDIPDRTGPDSPKLDALGDPLPPGAYARFGTIRLLHSDATAVAFLNDKTIVSVGSSIRFWDTPTGKLIREHRHEQMAGASADAISADGKRAVMLCGDDRFRVWEIGSGKLIREIKPDQTNRSRRVAGENMQAIVASGDGSSFVALEASVTNQNGRVGFFATVYSLDAKRRATKSPADSTDVNRCLISPDGYQVVTTSSTRSDDASGEVLTFVDAATGKHLRAEKANVGCVFSLGFMPDGKALIVTGENGTALRSLDGKELWRTASESDACHVVCTSAKRVVLTAWNRATERTSICILDAATGKVIGRWPMLDDGNKAAAVSPDGKQFAYVIAGRIHIVNLDDGKQLVPADGHGSAIFSAAVRSDGRFLATTDGEGRKLLLWDIANGSIARRFQRPGERALSVAISQNGKFLAATFTDKVVDVWDMATGREIARIERAWRRENTAIDFVGDDQRLAVVDAAELGVGNIIVYQIPSGKVVRQFPLPGQVALTGLFHTTGDQLLGVYSGFRIYTNLRPTPDLTIKGIDVWDVFAGRVMRHLDGDAEGWAHSAMSPDYRTVAARGHDGTIRLWELASGQPRLTIKENSKLPEADSWPKSLAFSPDGLTIATINYGKPGVDFWDLPAGRRVGSLQGHELPITMLEFTPDGRRLLTGSEDSTILGWDLTRPEWRSRSLFSNLSDADLARHWDRLRDAKADEAYRSKWALVGNPKKTVQFLQTRLLGQRATPVEKIKTWIADLDSNQFSVREKAQQQLHDHFDQADALLRMALTKTTSAEGRNRITRLLDANFAAIPPPDQLRDLRAIEVLEQIGTPEVRDLLRRLANSDVPTTISRDAGQSLKRLEQRRP